MGGSDVGDLFLLCTQTSNECFACGKATAPQSPWNLIYEMLFCTSSAVPSCTKTYLAVSNGGLTLTQLPADKQRVPHPQIPVLSRIRGTSGFSWFPPSHELLGFQSVCTQSLRGAWPPSGVRSRPALFWPSWGLRCWRKIE